MTRFSAPLTLLVSAALWSGCQGCSHSGTPQGPEVEAFDTEGYDSLDVAALDALRSEPTSTPSKPEEERDEHRRVQDQKLERKRDSLLLQQIVNAPTQGMTPDEKKAFVLDLATQFLEQGDMALSDSVFAIMNQPDMVRIAQSDASFRAALQPFIEAH